MSNGITGGTGVPPVGVYTRPAEGEEARASAIWNSGMRYETVEFSTRIRDIRLMPWIVLAGVVALALILFWLKRRADWSDAQTPVGTWVRTRAGGATVISFEGGPHEGLYRQIRKYGDVTEREFGHWNVSEGRLHLLIMATDVKDHPSFGKDVDYELIYSRKGADGKARRILIHGPGRKNLFFVRAEPGVVVDFGGSTLTQSETAG